MTTMRQTGSVSAYVGAFRALLVDMDTFAPPDDSARFHFIEGLVLDVRTHVMIHDPPDLESAMRVAERIGETTSSARYSSKRPAEKSTGSQRPQ